MYFPGAKLDDFGLSAVPGMTVSVAKGPAFEKLFKGKEALLPVVSVIDGIDVAWSPEAPAVLPTLGVSRGVVGTGGGQAPIDLSASIGWDFPLLTYKDYKLQ